MNQLLVKEVKDIWNIFSDNLFKMKNLMQFTNGRQDGQGLNNKDFHSKQDFWGRRPQLWSAKRSWGVSSNISYINYLVLSWLINERRVVLSKCLSSTRVSLCMLGRTFKKHCIRYPYFDVILKTSFSHQYSNVFILVFYLVGTRQRFLLSR